MPRSVGRLFPLALIALVAGCGDLTGPGDLHAARRLWESQNISSYEYVLRRLCFCGGPEGRVIVTVVDDAVVSVVEEGSRAPVQNVGYPTIDDLFSVAEIAHENDRLRAVEYDQDKGYPSLVDICCLEDDSGVRYVITDLQPVVVAALD